MARRYRIVEVGKNALIHTVRGLPNYSWCGGATRRLALASSRAAKLRSEAVAISDQQCKQHQCRADGEHVDRKWVAKPPPTEVGTGCSGSGVEPHES